MKERKIRLFFSLWPNEMVRNQIAAALNSFPSTNGRVVPRYNWHMTLHFIGNTTVEEKSCLDRQAKKVRASAFELKIDQTGHFKKPGVLWLGCDKPPQVLLDFQRHLGREISRCEYKPEARPYSPHLTVVRKIIGKPELKLKQKICWYVDKFVLIESESGSDGVRYKVIEEYGLD